MIVRRPGRNLVAALLLAGSMGLLFAAPAAACSCAETTVTMYVTEAPAVYVASPRAPDLFPGRSFRVERALKGTARANLRVPVNTDDEAACGTRVQPGPRLVTLDLAGNPRELNLCSEFLAGDEAVAEAQEVLGVGEPVAPQTDWSFILHWALAVVAAVGLVAAFGYGLRVQSRRLPIA